MCEPGLSTPAVCVYLAILNRNIQRMAASALQAGVTLRPHAKTHKTLEIAQRQLAAGAVGLTVAKLGEAEVLAAAGPQDILVAHQTIGDDKIARALVLHQQVPLVLGVDSLPGIRQISRIAAERGVTLPLAIEIDTGLRRAGVPSPEAALHLAREVVNLPAVELWGLFTHGGHAYGANPEDLPAVGRQEGELLVACAQAIRSAGIPVRVVSAGSTPTACHVAQVPGVTEIRPGNYVFHDAMQIRLGVATINDCALRVIATVVSRPAPDRAVIDAGAKTLALDQGAHGVTGLAGYGLVIGPRRRIIQRLSEEHGILTLSPEDPIQVGDRICIIPNHACAVVNLHDQLTIIGADGTRQPWKVVARGRTN